MPSIGMPAARHFCTLSMIAATLSGPVVKSLMYNLALGSYGTLSVDTPHSGDCIMVGLTAALAAWKAMLTKSSPRTSEKMDDRSVPSVFTISLQTSYRQHMSIRR
nr:hypothetical protein CFP56_55950 [Quercus suber]